VNASLDAALAAFPGAVPIPEFLDNVSAELATRGFTLEHTFAMVSTCRDELTVPLMRAVTERLDLAFNLGALGGVPSLGRTGWNAALSHVPMHEGRGHVVVLGMTHIGFGPDGTPGESLRRHQDHPDGRTPGGPMHQYQGSEHHHLYSAGGGHERLVLPAPDLCLEP
jgi:hypothetical protein